MGKETGFSTGPIIEEGFARIDGMDDLPVVAPGYPAIIDRLVAHHEESGVTLFTGGPLDLRRYGIGASWLMPAEVRDADGASQFHLLYVNTTPDASDPRPDVVVNTASESALKVGDLVDPAVAAFRSALLGTSGRPTVIVRPSIVGSLYYPEVATPAAFMDADRIAERIKRLTAGIGVEAFTTPASVADLSRRQFSLWSDMYPSIAVGWRERYLTEFGEVFMYPVLHPADPWQYYEIYTTTPLLRLNTHHPIHVRVDSGCDIGQMYLDDGCDCRAQFRNMLMQLGETGGIIIHAPTQDGRGYGMGTKMETEGLKRGVRVVTNREDPRPMGTVTAAKALFGDDAFDIRTYGGMGTVLRDLGFSSVYLHTDSRKKVEGIASVGIEVIRVPTDTVHDCTLSEDCRGHIAEKHAANGYYFPDL